MNFKPSAFLRRSAPIPSYSFLLKNFLESGYTLQSSRVDFQVGDKCQSFTFPYFRPFFFIFLSSNITDIAMKNTTTITLASAPPSLGLTGSSLHAIVVLLALTSFIFLLLKLLAPNKPYRGRKRRLPPEPAPWPIIGSLITMLHNKPQFRWLLAINKGRDITRVRLGGVHVIIVNSPGIAREFLKKHDSTFSTRPDTWVTRHWSRGYLTVIASPWGEQWKKMRRVVASAVVHPAKIRDYLDLRREEADHLVRYIYNRCRHSPIDLRLATRYYCGTIIRRMLFGVRHFGKGGDYGGPGLEEIEHVEAVFDVLAFTYAFNPGDYVPILRCLDIDGHKKKVRHGTSVLDKFHDPIIDERLEKWRGVNKGKKRKEVGDILDAFITMKERDGSPLLSREEIRAQCTELMVAVVDNPSNLVEWALAELLNQPSILEKAIQELDRMVGKDKLLQESDIPNLPYLRACARETIRLHPVAPFNVPHVATEDSTVAGYFIPKGSHVLLSRIGLGRNPKVWEDPLRFNPDRHLGGPDPIELAEPELKYVSFTTGRRGCVGGAMGSLMTYMLLGRLLQAFEWSLPLGETHVDLSEQKCLLFKGQPLLACAKPRLPWLASF